MLVVINSSFAPIRTRSFQEVLHADVLFYLQKVVIRGRTRNRNSWGSSREIRKGDYRTNFLRVLHLKQFLISNHIGSR